MQIHLPPPSSKTPCSLACPLTSHRRRPWPGEVRLVDVPPHLPRQPPQLHPRRQPQPLPPAHPFGGRQESKPVEAVPTPRGGGGVGARQPGQPLLRPAPGGQKGLLEAWGEWSGEGNWGNTAPCVIPLKPLEGFWLSLVSVPHPQMVEQVPLQ